MKVLLHICCANCAIFPVSVLREENWSVTGFFFNHNIHPYLEFRRRLETVREYAAKSQLPVIYREDYGLEEFLYRTAADPRSRCSYCYRSRMEEAARIASSEGFDAFTTSLLYSKYQNHDEIRSCGERVSAQYGIPFVYRDFRVGWRKGIDISKSLGLYRQQYCGCIYSEKDRYYRPGLKE